MTPTPARFGYLFVLIALFSLASCTSTTPAPTAIPPTAVPPTIAPAVMPTFTPPPVETADPPTPTLTPTATPTASPTRAVGGDLNPLTGLPAPGAKLQRRPVLVRIGNDPGIRPQTGLSAADVVFEDIMDSWFITRLTGVFLSQDPEVVGPIRSARLVNIELGTQFDGILVYSGASDPIRWRLSKVPFVAIEDYYDPAPFWLKPKQDWRGRLFTGVRQIREYVQKKKKVDEPEPLTGWTFDPAAPPGRPASVVDLPYPSNSTVQWKYEPPRGVYARYVTRTAHTDAANGKQLEAANVLVVYARHTLTDIIEDSNRARSVDISLTGSGRVVLFRDGVEQTGTWERRVAGELMQFYDEAGQPLKLKPGVSWVELVPTEHFVVKVTPGR